MADQALTRYKCDSNTAVRFKLGKPPIDFLVCKSALVNLCSVSGVLEGDIYLPVSITYCNEYSYSFACVRIKKLKLCCRCSNREKQETREVQKQVIFQK